MSIPKIDFLSMGQNLNKISNELHEGSNALANLQADVEDINMFGKDENNEMYAKLNSEFINNFTASMDERIADLKELKAKIEECVKQTQEYIDTYTQHVYSK